MGSEQPNFTDGEYGNRIDYQGQPQCHDWLKDGRIHWLPNRTRR